MLAMTVCLAPGGQAKQSTPHVATPAEKKAAPPAVAPLTHNDKGAKDNQTSNNQSPEGDTAAQWILVVATVITAAFICWQAWETRKAAEATKESVGLIKQKERARVRVDAVELRFVGGDVRRKGPPRPSDGIEFKVFCYGATDAFILETCYQLWIGPEMASEPPPNIPFNLPKVIRPADGGIAQFEPIDWLTDSMMVEAVKGGSRMTTFVMGFRVLIKYRDVFQRETHWQAQSTYTWKLTYLTGGGSEDAFAWGAPRQQDSEKECPN